MLFLNVLNRSTKDSGTIKMLETYTTEKTLVIRKLGIRLQPNDWRWGSLHA